MQRYSFPWCRTTSPVLYAVSAAQVGAFWHSDAVAALARDWLGDSPWDEQAAVAEATAAHVTTNKARKEGCMRENPFRRSDEPSAWWRDAGAFCSDGARARIRAFPAIKIAMARRARTRAFRLRSRKSRYADLLDPR